MTTLVPMATASLKSSRATTGGMGKGGCDNDGGDGGSIDDTSCHRSNGDLNQCGFLVGLHGGVEVPWIVDAVVHNSFFFAKANPSLGTPGT